ncbi:MAG TPA: chemotaxis protein CheC [Solirubrobacteraceae bacterium]|nr:chemotaxis protein CheC [Solirubrobacteraceae bacterium]
MTPRYTELQLDALRELANIASGNAATSLSRMLSREVDLSVPRVLALPLADAVDACGSADEDITGVVIPLQGDIHGVVLLLISPEGAATLCRLLGVEPQSDLGESALREIGNVLGTSCLNALASMTGLQLEPRPPHVTTDMLGAIVSSLALAHTASTELVLVLDSELEVSNEPCSISFVLLPTGGGVTDLLKPLGLAETTAS